MMMIMMITRYVSRDYVVSKELPVASKEIIMSDLKGVIDVIQNRTSRHYRKQSPPPPPETIFSLYVCVISRLTWFIVEFIRPSRFVNIPIVGYLLRSETWKGMRIQSPTCVLYQPFPEIPYMLKHISIIMIMIYVFKILSLSLLSSLFFIISILVVFFRGYYYEDHDKNILDDSDDDKVIVIEDGYVGYEGIVFNLTKSKPCIWIRGHADRSALLRLVRKRKKHLYWRSDENVMRCRLDSLGKINPKLFCIPSNLNSRIDNIHPRYHNITKQCNKNTPVESKIERYETLIVIVQFHHGYFHWITERLPTLYSLLSHVNQNTHFLIDSHFAGQEDGKENRWCGEFLKLLGIEKERVVTYRIDRVYYANRIIVLKDPVPTFHVHRNRLIRARDNISSLVLPSTSNLIKKIVLIRRGRAAARRWSNIDEISVALKKRYGNDLVRVLDFEDYSVREQIRICRDETLILLGIHGAGLSNLVWCSSSCSLGVVEILPPRPLFFRYLFWHLASSANIRYVV